MAIEVDCHAVAPHAGAWIETVIHLIAGAVIKTAKSERFGAVLNLDTIENISANEDFFTNLDSHLESGHKVVKELFFNILTEKSIASFEPEFSNDQ